MSVTCECSGKDYSSDSLLGIYAKLNFRSECQFLYFAKEGSSPLALVILPLLGTSLAKL